MFSEIELLTLLGGIVVLGFALWNREFLKKIPDAAILMGSYGCFLIAWFSTFAESFVFPDFFNITEHSMYAAGSILLCLWCYRSLWSRGDERE